MQVDVYHGLSLTASFVYGDAPRYYGPAGRDVRRRVAVARQRRPAGDQPERWLAALLGAALPGAGYQVYLSHDARALLQPGAAPVAGAPRPATRPGRGVAAYRAT
ncbi:MAG TPA: hypothetical protein VFW96_19135 [Thermomicrobiales bacterium]|nr:hypothetical protein [Thermomicrobiales bacterium]